MGEAEPGCNQCYIIDVLNNSSLRKRERVSESSTMETLVDLSCCLVIDALGQPIH